MGVVYEGWDARLNRRVAVKTLWQSLAQRAEARERFLREARAAAAVSHPNVTQIYDIGEEDGVVYFAMEYLDAPSLQHVLSEQGPLPPSRVTAIARQAALGLKAAADRGIIHRDVKPSNLVLASDGTVKVTDFGLAKQALVDGDLTLEGQTIGTPKYLSPEQASGGAVDARSDIYSLGVTMYEMVCGRPPFDGATPMEIMLKHVRDPVPPLQQAQPAAPRPVVAVIQRMLAKHPAARPQSYDELIQMLDRIAETSPVEAAVATVRMPQIAPSIEPAARTATSSAGRLFVLALLALLGVGAGGMVVRSLSGTRVERHRDAGARPALPAPEPVLETTPASGVAPTYPPPSALIERLPASGEGAVLEIVDTRHEFTEDGRMVVSGSVTNTGTSRAMRTKVRISLTDTAGAVLNSTEVFVHPEHIPKGQQGRFEAVFPDPLQNVKIVFELNWIS